jgi:hypothetical protein
MTKSRSKSHSPIPDAQPQDYPVNMDELAVLLQRNNTPVKHHISEKSLDEVKHDLDKRQFKKMVQPIGLKQYHTDAQEENYDYIPKTRKRSPSSKSKRNTRARKGGSRRKTVGRRRR